MKSPKTLEFSFIILIGISVFRVALLALSRLWGGNMGCVQGREHSVRASPSRVYSPGRFFSGTFLVVLILGVVYNCHLGPFLQS